MDAGSKYILEFIPEMAQALRGAKNLEKINQFVAMKIGKDYANMTKIVGKNIDDVSTKTIKVNGKEATQSMERLGIVTQDANGKFHQLTGTFTSVDGRLTSTSGKLKDVTGQFVKTNIETEKGKKNFLSLSENVGRLASRALLTIPLWMAFRTAMTSVFRTISDGLKGIIEQDRVFAKLRKNIQGTNSEIRAELNKAKSTIVKFSIESGKSVDDVTTAVQRFKTAGFDLDTSLSAGLDATRLSVILFGTAEETANAFARSMRVLATDTNNTAQTQREIAEAMALTSELWETNAFELDEFSKGLERFGGTGKALGLSMKEVITLLGLLSTRGLNANRAGKLLSTSTIKLQNNLDEVASVLGVKVNPEVDRTFDVFMRVVKAIAELRGEKGLDGLVKISPKVAEAVSKIFGGTKGGEPIFDIIADMEKISEEFDDFLSRTPDVNEMRKAFKDMDDDLFRQVEIYHNLNKEIGKALITGITGSDDFTKGLEKINELLTDIYSNAQNFGQFIHDIFPQLTAPGRDIIAIQMGIDASKIDGDVANIISSIENKFKDAKLFQFFEQLKTDIAVSTKFVLDKKNATKEIEILKDNIESSLDFVFDTKNLTQLESRLKSLLNDLLKVQSEKIDIGVPENIINNAIVKVRQELVDINKINLEIQKKALNVEKKSKEILLEKKDILKLEENIRKQMQAYGLDEVVIEEKILELREESGKFVEKDIALQQKLISHLKEMQNIEETRTRQRGFIDNQLLFLQLQGATNLELLKAERMYENLYGIKQGQIEQTQFELELQKEITKEKSAQNAVSSETVNLYKIAQKYGTKTAFDVSQFLKGRTSLPFSQEGKLVARGVGDEYKMKKALDEFFSSVVEARETMHFFSEGAGRFIPTAETGLRDINLPTQQLPTPGDLRVSQKLPMLPDIQLPEIITNIDTIKLELKQVLSDKKLSEMIVSGLIGALEGNNQIQQAIDERIEKY